MRFSPTYATLILAENYSDSKRLFLEHLMEIHQAHLVMLHQCQILDTEEVHKLAQALLTVDRAVVESKTFDGTFEDLFCLIEELLGLSAGTEVAGKLHTARSRNDIDVTLYRLQWRRQTLELALSTADLRRTLLQIAERERETLLPVHTHTQPAQPSTVAHYLLAVVEQLERDHQRLAHGLAGMNQSPMGACAACGTSFPIDRQLTAELLGFDRPAGNTYGSIASADYLLETMGAIMVLATGLGRVIQDWLLWVTPEFGYLRLADGMVQPSSIMPQKRNPVALEHARALISRALGGASSTFQMLHNTPFGDIVDIEDDLQPAVENTFYDVLRPVKLLSEVAATAEFDRDHLEQRCRGYWITTTELADTLVRREKLSFKAAHRVASCVAESMTCDDPPKRVNDCFERITGRPLGWSAEEISESLCPRQFVARRSHVGAPAPQTTAIAIAESERKLRADEQQLELWKERFRAYREKLAQRMARL